MWDGIGYNNKGEKIFEIKNGRCDKIKEFNKDGILIFEGEYINGIKYNGILYDINNPKNKTVIKEGKSKEIIKRYNKDNKLIFEGEYLEGVFDGKEYNDNGNLKYEGTFLDNKKWNGEIIETDLKIMDGSKLFNIIQF